jgi:GNAT superfamily N-acetyltransferase
MKYTPFAVERLRDILTLGIAMQEESDYSAVPFDIAQTANSIMALVVNNPRGFGMLAYSDENVPIGMIAGSISPYFFSQGSLASDFVWYVRPEFRGSRTSVKLLKMFQSWAWENGATELYMGVTTNVSAERTGELLQRLGFEHVGGNYRARLTDEA